MILRGVAFAVLLPAALVAAVQVASGAASVPPGVPDVTRLGILLILGGGLFAPFLGVAGRRTTALEVLALAVGGAGAWWLAGAAGLEGSAASEAMLVIVLAWLVPWCWSLPFRAAGWQALGRVIYLGSLALLIGTPYLVPPATSDLPPALRGSAHGPLPDWVTGLNPLARLHGSISGQDWLHGPLLYPRVGERYYQYPEGLAPAGPLLVAAAVALLLGLALMQRRRSAGITESDAGSLPAGRPVT